VEVRVLVIVVEAMEATEVMAPPEEAVERVELSRLAERIYQS
jgi:hypothetical protein